VNLLRTSHNRPLTTGLALLLLAEFCALPRSADAQAIQRPGDTKLELPGSDDRTPHEPILPPLPPMRPDAADRLSAGFAVFVHEFHITGSTVFSDEVLQDAVAAYRGREIDSEGLAQVRRILTLMYIEGGYVASGAFIPDQDVEDGVVHVEIREGVLSEIAISGTRRYRAKVLEERLTAGVAPPLRADAIEERLQLLLQDPGIEKVHARLRAGEDRGEARLEVEVEEAQPLRFSMRFANYEPPGIGGHSGTFSAQLLNPAGFGDDFSAEVRLSEGVTNLEGRYEIPFTPNGASLWFKAQYNEAKVVEGQFRDDDVENEFQAYTIALRHPILRSHRSSLDVSVLAEWRQSKTTFDGDTFSFPGSGSVDGAVQVAVLRFPVEWLYRDRSQAFAIRSTASVGLNVLGTTQSGREGEPGGGFVAWLGQIQWARRFEPLDSQLIVRGDLQVANEPLFTLEQFAVGGHQTVRGYRENQFVRDHGFVASAEYRIQVFDRPGFRLELAEFFDVGHAWNHSDRPPDSHLSDTLLSVGLGLRAELAELFHVQIYWGRQIFESGDSGNIQDDGLHFAISAEWP